VTSAREDAVPTAAVGPGERSVVRTIRGLHWWATLALAAVLVVVGVTVDLLVAGELGVVFTVCFAGGCVLATAWARRDELFVPMVQPPLLLVVAVPVVVAATGSLPSAGGTVSTLLAIGGPLINAFPTLALTTAACLALGFVRTRIEPYQPPDPDDLDGAFAPEARPRRRPAGGREPRDRDRDELPRRERPARDRPVRERDPRDRPPRDRDSRGDPRTREREPRERDRDLRERDGDPRDRDRDPRDRDPRDRDLRDRDRDRDLRDRDPRDRDSRERDPRDRPRRSAGERRAARERADRARRGDAGPDDPAVDDSHWDDRWDDPRQRAPRRRRPRAETGREDPRADAADEFGPGVRRVPRRIDGPPDERRPRP
jgi:hypothetical protein